MDGRSAKNGRSMPSRHLCCPAHHRSNFRPTWSPARAVEFPGRRVWVAELLKSAGYESGLWPLRWMGLCSGHYFLVTEMGTYQKAKNFLIKACSRPCNFFSSFSVVSILPLERSPWTMELRKILNSLNSGF